MLVTLPRYSKRTPGNPTDKRQRILMCQVREWCEEYNVEVRHVDEKLMLADALTKLTSPEFLVNTLMTCEWSIIPTAEALEAKARLSVQRKARTQGEQSVTDAAS